MLVQIGQLYKIFEILGTPSENLWKGVSSMPDWQTHFPQWLRQDLAQVFLIPEIPMHKPIFVVRGTRQAISAVLPSHLTPVCLLTLVRCAQFSIQHLRQLYEKPSQRRMNGMSCSDVHEFPTF